MTDVKIKLELGEIKLNIECDPMWLSDQIRNILRKPPETQGESFAAEKPEEEAGGGAGEEKPEGLKDFLKRKRAMKTNNKQFLGTAVWLTGQGRKKLTTRDIKTAMRENGLPRINNPANCLYQMKNRGFCRGEGKGFTVTDEGEDWL